MQDNTVQTNKTVAVTVYTMQTADYQLQNINRQLYTAGKRHHLYNFHFLLSVTQHSTVISQITCKMSTSTHQKSIPSKIPSSNSSPSTPSTSTSTPTHETSTLRLRPSSSCILHIVRTGAGFSHVTADTLMDPDGKNYPQNM